MRQHYRGSNADFTTTFTAPSALVASVQIHTSAFLVSVYDNYKKLYLLPV